LKSASLTNKEQSREDKDLQARLKKAGKIPDHVAIIMDGNGRWAKHKGSLRTSGHKAGVDSVRDITEACAQLGIKYLTLYTFSTENWDRPETEIHALMQILVHSLRKEAENLDRTTLSLQR
jgi:undecaprenyl diphosphate synthase